MKRVEDWLLPVGVAGEGSAAGAPLVMAERVLEEFGQQPQEQDKWCWAAVTSSIAFFYNPASTWIQCQLATVLLGAECCLRPYSPACNKGFPMRIAMQRAQVWTGATPGKPPYSLPTGELNEGRPMGIVIRWMTGVEHALSIFGYAYDTQRNIYRLLVGDPWSGPCCVDYNNFPAWYGGGATWINTETS